MSAVSTSARAHRYLHYDVFTDTALTGNQLAVFTNPFGLTTDDMARVTRAVVVDFLTLAARDDKLPLTSLEQSSRLQLPNDRRRLPSSTTR